MATFIYTVSANLLRRHLFRPAFARTSSSRISRLLSVVLRNLPTIPLSPNFNLGFGDLVSRWLAVSKSARSKYQLLEIRAACSLGDVCHAYFRHCAFRTSSKYSREPLRASHTPNSRVAICRAMFFLKNSLFSNHASLFAHVVLFRLKISFRIFVRNNNVWESTK